MGELIVLGIENNFKIKNTEIKNFEISNINLIAIAR